MSDITIERLSAAIAVIETIATNNGKVLATLGVSVKEVLTVCQYARKEWYDMNGGKRK